MRKLGFIFTVGVLFVCYFFWQKYTTIEDQFQTYLEKKYQEKMQVTEIHYDIMHNLFSASAYPRANEEIKFYVGQNQMTKVIEDNYAFKYWSYFAKKEINPIIKSCLNPERYSLDLHTSQENVSPPLPNYKYVSTVIIGVEKSRVDVSIHHQKELANVYKFLQILKNMNVGVYSLDVIYAKYHLRITTSDVSTLHSETDLNNFLFPNQ